MTLRNCRVKGKIGRKLGQPLGRFQSANDALPVRLFVRREYLDTTGSQGPRGLEGSQGDQGSQGIQRVQGNQGDQGVQGVPGGKAFRVTIGPFGLLPQRFFDDLGVTIGNELVSHGLVLGS